MLIRVVRGGLQKQLAPLTLGKLFESLGSSFAHSFFHSLVHEPKD